MSGTAAWKGTAVHVVLEAWLKQDDCDPATLVDRARALVGIVIEHIDALGRKLAIELLAGAIDAAESSGRTVRDELERSSHEFGQRMGTEAREQVIQAMADRRSAGAPKPKPPSARAPRKRP